MTPRDDATNAQIIAARPDASTWLAANAGSGKTRVLTDRVARLLLDGVEPQHILCLTYTKAAASEMQNRLFKRLGEWAMLEETALRRDLAKLGATGPFDDARLKEARTLFARAIETPGGLKIQTIHSFCASLLRRFPLEARVSPQFTEIEDRAADLLRAEIVDQMAEGPDTALISALAEHDTGDDFDKLTRAIVQHRDGFADPLDRACALKVFDLPPTFTRESIVSSVFDGDEQAMLDRMIPVMLEKGGNDAKAAQKILAVGALEFESLAALESVLLSGKSAKLPFAAKIGSFPTKATQDKLSNLMPQLDALMQRMEDARQPRLGLLAAEKTAALHAFATRFLSLYEQAKTLRGWLDFDDLIDRARALLTDEKVAAWVLFRIDGGIDHILVDEAQDTSPAQWDVIRKLAAEFTSGQGAREEDRTIFVVGDKKQSIYSFQGADPREFDRMQQEFGQKLRAAERDFQDRTLQFSFRSASAVLAAVDKTFENHEAAGFSTDAPHKAFKSALPGRVDLWPVIEPQPDPDDVPWYTPLDIRSPQHHSVVLAEQVAAQVKWMIESGQTIPDDEDSVFFRRPVRAGDFLILVQRRGALFSEIIRACKSAGLDIAGADRLKVGGELAVRDLAALLSFLAMPDDSLSLASALKSPLFGWDEQKLFDLAHRRTEQTLWAALRKRAKDYPEDFAILQDLRDNVDFLRPYDLIERILTRHKGRRKLLARLGTEAEDGINALLSQALAFERTAVPSLTGFLVWMETDDLEIKRQIDSASNQIRVMTVHGAKGLEAPIVILPDSGQRRVDFKDSILSVEGHPCWKTAADAMPDAMSTELAARKEAETQERLRLLYVAMTRAEKWLIVAAAGELPKEPNSWYQIVDLALTDLGTRDIEENGLQFRRHEAGDWTGLPLVQPKPEKSKKHVLEPYFGSKAPPPNVRPKAITPSDLGGAKALPGEDNRDEEAAKTYGTLVHRLIEQMAVLSVDDWPLIAKAHADAPEMEEAYYEAARIVQNPDLRRFFTPDTFAEVPVSAVLGEKRLHGVIDRLIVDENRILAVDFKTNKTVPKTAETCPEGILRQMAAYAHALAQVYPGRTIGTAVLWTRTADLMPLPQELIARVTHDIVRVAASGTPYLDDPGDAT